MARKSRTTLSLDEAMRHNLILFNNPVLIQGLALTPVVAAAVSLKTACILSVVAAILIVPTRVAGDLLIGYVAKNLRPMIYAILSSLCFVPALLLAELIFGLAVRGPENYLLLLVVDGIVLSRAEIPAREGIGRALGNGILTALGFSLVLCLVGSVRDLLSNGKIWDLTIHTGIQVPIASTVVGGLLITAMLSALLQWLGTVYKRFISGGVKEQ